MKVVQEMLRHSSITVAGDTCTSVLTEVARDAAEKDHVDHPSEQTGTLGLPSGRWETTVDGEYACRKYQKARVNMNVDLRFLVLNTEKGMLTGKSTCPLGVRRQGLEPRTRWLRASCSAS
jgi:hypothetical protein